MKDLYVLRIYYRDYYGCGKDLSYYDLNMKEVITLLKKSEQKDNCITKYEIIKK